MSGGWLRDTLAVYGRVLGEGLRLTRGNPVLIVPALACLVGPVLALVVLTPLASVGGAFGSMLVGIAVVLIDSACWSAMLACTGEVLRSHRLVLADVRAGFLAHLGDVINVRFVIFLVTFVLGQLPPSPLQIVVPLAMVVFFNAVPELIYLGRYPTTELLAASYRFIGERWVEWFPLNGLLAAMLLAVLALVALLPAPAALPIGMLAVALLIAFGMLVRGLLFLALTQSGRRARAFREAMGGR